MPVLNRDEARARGDATPPGFCEENLDFRDTEGISRFPRESRRSEGKKRGVQAPRGSEAERKGGFSLCIREKVERYSTSTRRYLAGRGLIVNRLIRKYHRTKADGKNAITAALSGRVFISFAIRRVPTAPRANIDVFVLRAASIARRSARHARTDVRQIFHTARELRIDGIVKRTDWRAETEGSGHLALFYGS